MHWENLRNNGIHGVGIVHRYLLDSQSLIFRYLYQYGNHFRGFCSPYSSDKGTLLAMAVLVGKESEQIPCMHTLVYTHMLTYVLFQQYTVARMFKLVLLTKTAQVFLVILFQCLTVYFVVPLQGAAGIKKVSKYFFKTSANSFE